MALQYVQTGYLNLYPALQQHITYVTTRPAIPAAPGVESPFPGADQQDQQQQQTIQPAVNLDELIRKRREKARRMKQR
jgi:hypothetical protein